MHSVKLKNVKWQNLLSYGTNINEVSLDNDGITWIKGPNGVGKSTIIEAITVALFLNTYFTKRTEPIKFILYHLS